MDLDETHSSGAYFIHDDDDDNSGDEFDEEVEDTTIYGTAGTGHSPRTNRRNRSGTGSGNAIDVVRASSIGCIEEEKTRRLVKFMS